MSDLIRVFIGTEAKTEVYRHVLQHSITSRTKAKVEFTPMIGRKWEYPTAGLKVGTGFSLRRWMIPAACGWRGRAIYLDADQTVFADIAELWGFPDRQAKLDCSAWLTYQPDKFCKSPWPQSSVMVIDCVAAEKQPGWRIDWLLKTLQDKPIKDHYAAIMHGSWMTPAPEEIPVVWNHLNQCDPGKTKLWHDTHEPRQVVYAPKDNMFTAIWEKEAVAAIKAGAVSKDLIEDGLKAWGKKEDWRPTNGLHPYWRKLLDFYPK